ncbi:MAG: methyltransferase domain-containing protein [Methanomicrobiales archaeon]|nr:methyltransferase domain-containing protein [Methanomicrobiales archaeon]
MKLLFELSGEHPGLPAAELECVGRVVDRACQVAVADVPDPAAASRLSLTHVVMEYLGECRADREAVAGMLNELALASEVPFAARVKKIQGTAIAASQLDLERLLGTCIAGPVSLSRPAAEYRLVCSGERCFLGRVLFRTDRGSYAYRNPMRRPFFHPGVMMPILARALVNLSRAGAGERLFDPFCGTGGVLLEGRLLGMEVLGSDMDPAMLAGCRANLPDAELMRADATDLPLRDGSVDAVVTDLPYGQSVCIRGSDMDRLYDASLAEIRRVLRPGRRAVVVTHRDIGAHAGNYFRSAAAFEQRVHKSLTRRILVLE